MKPKFFIQTYGCQMNKIDSERIVGFLTSYGFSKISKPENADILIINTCSVRQSAEDRVFGTIRNWQKIKEKNPAVIIAVTGCMPGRDKTGAIKRRLKNVDLFFGIDELPRFPEWLKELNSNTYLFDKKNKADVCDYLEINPVRNNQHQAYITIQTGCNNFCSYCVVPHARGRERNRSVVDILLEANVFAEQGGVEITLLGQVVNHYIAPDPENFLSNNPFVKKDDFSALLWELNQISKIQRINFTASHPKFFNDFQIEALKLPKLVNYLHLPAQSGDDEILKKMNRGYDSKYYINLLKKIRHAISDMAIGTDLIVGFCGETEKQFNNTLEFYKKCDFDIAYTAIYSKRSGTVACDMYKDDVLIAIKKERWHRLQELMEKITHKKNKKYIEQEVEVLVESCAGAICSGNSRELKLVQFMGSSDLIGRIVNVKIFEAYEWVLKGEIVK